MQKRRPQRERLAARESVLAVIRQCIRVLRHLILRDDDWTVGHLASFVRLHFDPIIETNASQSLYSFSNLPASQRRRE